MPTTYLTVVGLSYANKRAEAGDVINDLPESSVPWLIEQGLIKPSEEAPISKSKKREPQSPTRGDE